MDINIEIKEAQGLYKTLTDETYLLARNVKEETYSEMMKQFISAEISKKDFSVLLKLVEEYLDWDKQLFSFKYEYLIDLAPKSNISRSIKNLIEHGFIEKFPFDKPKLQYYFFRTQYNAMKAVI